MTTFLIVRHGLSQSNKTRCYTGQNDVPLDETGLEQGRLVSEYIYKNYKIDAIYSSDLSRAVDTISRLGELTGIEIKKLAGLREVDMGDWVGVSFDDIKTRFPEEHAFNRANPLKASYSGGENYSQFTERISNAIENIAAENDGKTVVISTHAGVIRAFLRKFGLVSDNESNADIIVPNTGINVFEYENGKVKVIELGIVKHLDELKV